MFQPIQLENDFFIGEFEEKDFASLEKIIGSFPLEFSEHDQQLFRQEFLTYLKEKDPTSLEILCLRQKDQPIGCVSFYPDAESDTYGYIGWVVIKKDFQNRGLGTFLLKAACEELKKQGYRYVSLKTIDREYNEKVKQFYEKRGFVHVGIFPGYYLQPTATKLEEEDCVMYYKKLL